MSIEKAGDREFVIADTPPRSGYNDGGGTYLLLGRWQTPRASGGTVTFAPDFASDAKPLAVQALMIRLGTGSALAR